MMFNVGQKVELVNDDFNHLAYQYYEHLPEKKVAYKVRDILPHSDETGRQFIYLVEIKNPSAIFSFGTFERPFPSERFRPIVEHKTDISIFTELLTKVDA